MAMALAMSGPAAAGDVCCASLEQRIADLEQQSVRTGKPKHDLEISGTISYGILLWDDGAERDAYVLGNDNDSTSFAIDGSGVLSDLDKRWTYGFALGAFLEGAVSGGADQHTLGPSSGASLREADLRIGHEDYGSIRIGFTSPQGAASGANSSDLSGTDQAGYVRAADIGGGFFLRRAGRPGDGGLLGLTWRDLIDPMSTPGSSVLAYESPTYRGFGMSALWADGGIWNVTAGYEKDGCTSGESRNFAALSLRPIGTRHKAKKTPEPATHGSMACDLEIEGALGYSEVPEGADENPAGYSEMVGSFAVLHTPSGLNAALAAGWRTFDGGVPRQDGALTHPADVSFYYVKAGWRASLIAAGSTNLYVENARYKNALGAASPADLVANAAGLDDATALCGEGLACTASSSVAAVWGAGVVQDIDEIDAAVFVGYRHFDAKIGLADAGGKALSGPGLAPFQTAMFGMTMGF